LLLSIYFHFVHPENKKDSDVKKTEPEVKKSRKPVTKKTKASDNNISESSESSELGNKKEVIEEKKIESSNNVDKDKELRKNNLKQRFCDITKKIEKLFIEAKFDSCRKDLHDLLTVQGFSEAQFIDSIAHHGRSLNLTSDQWLQVYLRLNNRLLESQLPPEKVLSQNQLALVKRV
jgi:hypothetical protein